MYLHICNEEIQYCHFDLASFIGTLVVITSIFAGLSSLDFQVGI